MIDTTAVHVQEEATAGKPRISLYAPPPWDYFRNGGIQEIIPGLFLGPYSAAQLHCLSNLKEKRIRYIICVRQESEAHFIRPQINDPSFTYLTLDIADRETENIMRFFPKVNNFIDEAFSRNFKVLVHGNSGNSRSATLVLAYIMEKFGLSMSEALGFVKAKRPTVEPNEGFKAQLSEYEPIYKARLTLTNGGSSSSNKQRPKRKSEQLCDTGLNTYDYDLIPPPPSPTPYDANNILIKNISSTGSEFSNHLYRLWLAKR